MSCKLISKDGITAFVCERGSMKTKAKSTVTLKSGEERFIFKNKRDFDLLSENSPVTVSENKYMSDPKDYIKKFLTFKEELE
jgi:hypothetical protein